MLEERTGFKFGDEDITLLGKDVKVGDKALNFKAINDDKVFDFYKETDGKIKIISVVPSLDTSVCSIQTVKFNAEAEKFSNDIVIISVSDDLQFAQKRFKDVKKINNITFVSDHINMDFGEKYGVLIKELRLLNRSVFVIDKDNYVRYVEYVKQNTELPNIKNAINEAVKLV
ncbi:MAG: thiol peroxidase [Peptoniphilaceae bacterium]|nr:thiol peroxidase [Peptoniphilaceae bacterium]MDD7383317.1 thiol peroxidase [Peptoniphilaceae bacterium]MDY3738312.1 thiol peroxidase [Peptoniphilaceae bacterium]